MARITAKEKKNVLKFIFGLLVFFLFFQLLGHISPYINGINTPQIVITLYPFIVIAVFFIFTYILLKISRYTGLGFLLAVPAGALGIAMLLFELWIHPPEE